MRDFACPAPGVNFIGRTAAEKLDQIQDRLAAEVKDHQRQATSWPDGREPNVELTLEEARIAIENLAVASHLLRLAAEGLLQ